MRTKLTILTLALTAGAMLPASAEAQRYREDVVVAESRYGNGTVSGPVRPGRNGWQVRMPGGSWIDCGRSCSETLRRNTVDFWQSSTSTNQGDASPGYFRFEFGRRGY